MQSGDERFIFHLIKHLDHGVVILPRVRHALLHLALSARQVAVNKHEASVVVVEPHSYGSLIGSHTFRSSLVLDGFEGLERGLLVAARKEHDVAPEHDLAQDAGVAERGWSEARWVRTLVKTEADQLLPLVHAVEVLGAEQGADNFKIDHLLQADDVKVWYLVLCLSVGLEAILVARVGQDDICEVKILRRRFPGTIPGEYADFCLF